MISRSLLGTVDKQLKHVKHCDDQVTGFRNAVQVRATYELDQQGL